MVQQPTSRFPSDSTVEPIPTAADRQFARTVPTAVKGIRALAEGALFGVVVSGTCMMPAGIFDGDLAVLRRQDHADDGEIVVAHHRHQRLGLPWLALKHYQPAGPRVRLVPADPAVAPVELDGDQVAILGVLVGVDGTVRMAAEAELVCVMHQRFLRPVACTACQLLACGRVPMTVAARTGLRPNRATATAAAGPFGLVPPLAGLLDRLAQRLLDQLDRADGKPTLTIALDDLGEHADPIDVYNALLQGAGAFAQNQQLRAYLDRLAGDHAITALTAALLWELLASAARVLEGHSDLSEQERGLVRALERMASWPRARSPACPRSASSCSPSWTPPARSSPHSRRLRRRRPAATRNRSAAASGASPKHARTTARWSPATSTRPSARSRSTATHPRSRSELTGADSGLAAAGSPQRAQLLVGGGRRRSSARYGKLGVPNPADGWAAAPALTGWSLSLVVFRRLVVGGGLRLGEPAREPLETLIHRGPVALPKLPADRRPRQPGRAHLPDELVVGPVKLRAGGLELLDRLTPGASAGRPLCVSHQRTRPVQRCPKAFQRSSLRPGERRLDRRSCSPHPRMLWAS